MRTKKLIPVGQGCRRMKFDDKLTVTLQSGCCACHPDKFLSLCLGCHEWFHSDMPHTKTCSDKCRKRLSRSRHDKFFQTVLAFANGLTS